jgi:hypothetical protein
VAILDRELRDGGGALLEVGGERGVHRRGEIVDGVVERRGGTRRSAAVAGVDGGGKLVELVAERIGLIGLEQARSAATAGDEERHGKAKPAGKECAGCVAHP